MNLDNCLDCGKLMIKKSSHFCIDCLKAHSEDMQKIKDFLYKNPFSNYMEVHQQTGIPLKTIKDLILDRSIEIRL